MKRIIMKVSTALAAFVLVMNASFASVNGALNEEYLKCDCDTSYSKTVKKAANKEYTVIGVYEENEKKITFSENLANKGNVIMTSKLSSNMISITNTSAQAKDLHVLLTKTQKQTGKTTKLGESKVNKAVRVGCGTGYKRAAKDKTINYTMTAEYKKPYSKYNNPGGDHIYTFNIEQ